MTNIQLRTFTLQVRCLLLKSPLSRVVLATAGNRRAVGAQWDERSGVTASPVGIQW